MIKRRIDMQEYVVLWVKNFSFYILNLYNSHYSLIFNVFYNKIYRKKFKYYDFLINNNQQ